MSATYALPIQQHPCGEQSVELAALLCWTLQIKRLACIILQEKCMWATVDNIKVHSNKK